MRPRHTIGRHRWRLILCRQVLAAKDDVGEEVPTWPMPEAGENEWWASLDTLSAGETIAAGIRQTTEALRLRVARQFPGTAKDRVRDKRTGTLYAITGVGREDVETVLTIEIVSADPGVLLLQDGTPLLLESGGLLLLEA